MIEFPRRWRLFDFLDSRGLSVFAEWAKDVDKKMRARVNQKLDLLERHGPDLPPGLLAGTKFKHVDKLRIFGPGVTWRVLICKGPIVNDHEFTILFIAQEKDRKLIPEDADRRADDNRKEIISDPERRRIHERIS